jgi:hypothetical protein
VAPIGHLNIHDAAVQRWLILLLMHALAHRILLTAKVLPRAWFDRRVWFPHASSLD